MLTQMLNKHCFLRNYVSCIQLNIVVQITFLIATHLFWKPIWAAWKVSKFELLLNRPDDYVLATSSSMIKLRVQLLDQVKSSVGLKRFPTFLPKTMRESYL